jgi:hypothetical protein
LPVTKRDLLVQSVLVIYAGLRTVKFMVIRLAGPPIFLIKVHIPYAAERRFDVGLVPFRVAAAAERAALLPSPRLVRHTIERPERWLQLAIVGLVLRLQLHVVFSLVEKLDQPVNLVSGFLAKPADSLKGLLRGDIGGRYRLPVVGNG